MSLGLSIAVYTAIGVALLVVGVTLFRSEKPIRFAFSSLVEGVCAIAAIDVVGTFTGLSLGFGWFSMVCCAAFGIPGVLSVLVMRLITLL